MITMGEKRKENMPCSVRQTTSLDESCRKHGNSKPITWLVDAMNSKSKDLIFDDRPVIPGITIKAARLDALIHLLVNSFMPVGGLEMGNDNFPRIVFLMHQWFIKSDELAEELVELFWHCDKLFTCHSRCRHSLKQVAECQVYRFRARICHTFRYWVLTFPIHFDLNPTLTSKIYDFQIQLRNREYHGLAEFVDLSKLPSYDWTRNISVRHPPAKHTRKVSLVFDHLEAGELAEHITYLEHKVMRRITFIDFKNYAEKGTLQDNPKLERSIALFNGLSQWIQCMVLTRSLPQQRADVIVKFVSVAKKLLQLKNFNSLMAVVGGLCHSALARLSHTMAFVPSEAQKSLADLTELLSSTSNFSNYRKSLAESTGFRIPILGVHMKDLISLEVALPDTLDKDPEFINFRKIAQLSLIFQELWELQNSIPSLSVNLDLVNTLRLSLDTAYTEDELYELSLTLEPRNPTSPQLSPTKPTVFAEWATGSCNPPEPEVLEKHINAMVEAVFKNYDTDKDGYISHEEFEAIASNFPFIDAFCILDVDQDGMISKTEMKRYFLQANCRTLRTSFQHDFHETTYFRPTFCARCAGLLWGLIKQGYKCRDCGINAHKHCKELIVLECRRNNMLSPRSNSFAGTDASTIKSRFQRHWRKHSKISQSEGDGSINPRMSTESCHCDNGFITVETPTDELRQSINSVKAASFDVKDLDVLIKDSISVSISRDLPAAESHCRCQQDVYLSKSSIENVYSQSSLISHPNS